MFQNDNVLQGTGYTVTENVVPRGWDLQSIDCNVTAHPSVGVSPTIELDTNNRPTGKVTLNIDDADDQVDCTYTNRGRGTITVEKITDDGRRWN